MKKVIVCWVVAVMVIFLQGRGFALDNRSDEFFAGRYGGIDPGFVCDQIEMQLVEEYGFDWLWLQHQGIIPMIKRNDPSVERLKKLVGRTRIIYRGWFLGGKYADGGAILYFDGDERLNGKDWIHLADSDELLQLSLNSIDNQIDLLLKTLGNNSVYAVSIGEEEPQVGMGFGRGIGFFDRNKDENTRKLIKVNNRIYEHLKQRYPDIKVAISYYTDTLPDWAYQEFKYDCIVMDSYPGSNANLETELKLWKTIYPPTKEVYLLLWGAGQARQVTTGPPSAQEMKGYSLLSRARETSFARLVFDKFYEAGYRNLGWFGLYTHAPVVPAILSWIDQTSPGTYREMSTKEYGQLVQKRTAHYETLLCRVTDRMNAATRKKLGNARKTLKETTSTSSEQEWRRVLSSYHEVCLATLSESDPLVEKLRGAMTVKDVTAILSLPSSVLTDFPNETSLKSLMAKASRLETLPDFYKESAPVLGKINNGISTVLSAINTAYVEPSRKKPGEVSEQTANLAGKIASCLKSGDTEVALQSAKALASLAVEAGLVQKPLLSIVLINPYQFPVNGRPLIASSENGKDWTILYDDEPFHADTSTIRMLFPVSEKTRFVKIVNHRWIGWFNVDLVEIKEGKKRKAPLKWQVQGDVRNPENVLLEDGKYCLIVNNTGGEEVVVFEF